MNEEEIKMAQQTETTPEQETTTTVAEETKPRGMAAMRSRLSEKDPEGGWGDAADDDVADKAMSNYDEMYGRMQKRDEADAQMEKLFADNPQSAQFLRGMARGEDFLDNLAKNFGEDIVAAMNDPEKRDQLKASFKEYQDKVANNKKLQQEWQQNSVAALDAIEAEQERRGISDEEMADAFDNYKKAVDAWNSGNFDFDTVYAFAKAKNHDADVEAARRDGEIDGRNAKINEGMRKRAADTDGIASLGGQSRVSSEGREMRQKGGRGMAVGSGIWDAGNFHRNQYD